jgi:hypothetical protein
MIPRETEDARRKRKVREWLAELGPGLDVQVGVDSVSAVELHDSLQGVSLHPSCFEAKGKHLRLVHNLAGR